MMKSFKFGRWWFTTRKEAEKERKYGDSVFFDSCQEAYYIKEPRKSLWNF